VFALRHQPRAKTCSQLLGSVSLVVAGLAFSRAGVAGLRSLRRCEGQGGVSPWVESRVNRPTAAPIGRIVLLASWRSRADVHDWGLPTATAAAKQRHQEARRPSRGEADDCSRGQDAPGEPVRDRQTHGSAYERWGKRRLGCRRPSPSEHQVARSIRTGLHAVSGGIIMIHQEPHALAESRTAPNPVGEGRRQPSTLGVNARSGGRRNPRSVARRGRRPKATTTGSCSH
jgi:hypothetical protein